MSKAPPEPGQSKLPWILGLVGVIILGYLSINFASGMFGGQFPEVYLLGEPTRSDSWDLYLWQEGEEPERIARDVSPLTIGANEREEDPIVAVGKSEVAVAFQEDGDNVLVVGDPSNWSEARELWRSDTFPRFSYRAESELFLVGSGERCYVVDLAGNETRLAGTVCRFAPDDPNVVIASEWDGDRHSVEIFDYSDELEFNDEFDEFTSETGSLLFVTDLSRRGAEFSVHEWRTGEVVFESEEYASLSFADLYDESAIVITDQGDGLVTAWLYTDERLEEIGSGWSAAGQFVSPEVARIVLTTADESDLYEVSVPKAESVLVATVDQTDGAFQTFWTEDPMDTPVLWSHWNATRHETEFQLVTGNVISDFDIPGVVDSVAMASIDTLLVTSADEGDVVFTAVDLRTMDTDRLNSGEFLQVAAVSDSGQVAIVIYADEPALAIFDPVSGQFDDIYEGDNLWNPTFNGDSTLVYISDGFLQGDLDLISINIETSEDDVLFRDLAMFGTSLPSKPEFRNRIANRIESTFESAEAECEARDYDSVQLGESQRIRQSVTNALRRCFDVDFSGGLWVAVESLDGADLSLRIVGDDGEIAYSDDYNGLDPAVFLDAERGTYLLEIADVSSTNWDADFVLHVGS